MNRYKSILLIEDDGDDQYFFTEALKAIDPAANLVIAENGYDALKLLATPHPLPDLLFLDLHAPIMDGFEFLKEFGKVEKYKSIPVIVFSSTRFRIDECYDLGVVVAIEKSTTPKGLESTLAEVLHRDVVKEAAALRQIFSRK